MGLDIKAPENVILTPVITVFGVGGAGGNAVNNMLKSGLKGANFVVTNTDAQALMHSQSKNKIQLGVALTKGLGAGASPDVGKDSAIESESEIRSHLEGSNMVFMMLRRDADQPRNRTQCSPLLAVKRRTSLQFFRRSYAVTDNLPNLTF